jgi:hypothetical protein
MSNIIIPGQGIIYMKVGVHAQETLEDIIERKKREINEEGFALWGYGGNTCYPSTVRDFAIDMQAQQQTIYLCMQEMNSKHSEEPIRADLYSSDGVNYQPIPPAINVLGSRFALAIKNLHAETFDLSLSKCQVALGPSKGRLGRDYIQRRVDKACFTIAGDQIPEPPENQRIVPISLVAELCDPFAVFLKNS